MTIRQKDVQMSFVRSSGAGGQNVNKVATQVVLKHIPSGLVIHCDKHRTQIANRLEAFRILEKKLKDLEMKKIFAVKALKAKIKRQQQHRSKAEQEKLLNEKKKLSQKKAMRKNINLE